MLKRRQPTHRDLESLILKEFFRMSVALDNLTAKVETTIGVAESAITLIGGLSQQLKDALANNDTDALNALAAELDAEQAKLAAAVAANQPAPAPAPAPVETPAPAPVEAAPAPVEAAPVEAAPAADAPAVDPNTPAA